MENYTPPLKKEGLSYLLMSPHQGLAKCPIDQMQHTTRFFFFNNLWAKCGIYRWTFAIDLMGNTNFEPQLSQMLSSLCKTNKQIKPNSFDWWIYISKIILLGGEIPQDSDGRSWLRTTYFTSRGNEPSILKRDPWNSKRDPNLWWILYLYITYNSISKNCYVLNFVNQKFVEIHFFPC